MHGKPDEDRMDALEGRPDGVYIPGGGVRVVGGVYTEGRAHRVLPEAAIHYLRDGLDEAADLRRFYRYSSSPCLTLTREGHIARLNPAAARLLGGSPAGLQGRRFADYVAEAQRTAFEYFLAAAFVRGRAGGCELGLRPHKRGPEPTVLAEAAADAIGQRCLLMLVDLTEHRHADDALREVEAFGIGVLNALPSQIAVLDPDGVIRAVNTAWQRFAIENGAEALALHPVGMSYRDACLLPPEEPDSAQARAAWEGIERVMRGGVERFTMEYSCDSPGEQRWYQLTAYPLVAPQRGVVVAHEDISARKRAEHSLQQARLEAERANNAKSRLLAAVSHDLRQPLSALGLYVGLLDRHRDESEAMLIRSMKDCVASLSALLTDVLNLSRLEAGALQPQMTDFPIDELLDRIVSVNTPEAMLKHLSLRRARCAPGLCARTDPVLFGRILDNLVSNAVRYTNGGGVLVGCRRSGGRRWIEVWDTGVGIPEASIAEIFDEYRQLDNADRTRGSGLGLAIVEKLARLLGLRIRVASRPGRGSMFAVEMPPGRALHHGDTAVPPLRKVRIGLVEDDPRAARRIGRALTRLGHQVIVAPNGAGLLLMLDGRPPDVVVADYRLREGENGLDAIELVRRHHGEHLPAVMLAGEHDPDIMRSMADRGIVVQHKPVASERLAPCIAGLTERRAG
ncbi:PAS domain-containing hybrid sensor histidine kinase/response regulator [Pseudothauera rhizosphaerae]|nr:ATP-binding protein [Pseudothauera rhizosphaerae]